MKGEERRAWERKSGKEGGGDRYALTFHHCGPHPPTGAHPLDLAFPRCSYLRRLRSPHSPDTRRPQREFPQNSLQSP